MGCWGLPPPHRVRKHEASSALRNDRWRRYSRLASRRTMNTKPNNNDLLGSSFDSVSFLNHVDRSATPTVSEGFALCDFGWICKNVKHHVTHSRVNWPGLADHYGLLPSTTTSLLHSPLYLGDPLKSAKTPRQSARPLMSVKTCIVLYGVSSPYPLLEDSGFETKPWFNPRPFESVDLFRYRAQLNGTHGEYTDDDDLADFERKRQQKEASNKKIHGKPGNSHKPMNPGIKTNNLCQDFLLTSQCLVPGCPFVHNRGVLCPNVNCAVPNCPHVHRFEPPAPIEPPQVLVPLAPEFEDVAIVARLVPTNRVDRIMYSNSIITRIVIFMVWSIVMITIREFFAYQSLISNQVSYTVFQFCYWYLDKVRFINSVLFILSLQYSDEYVELIRHIKTRRYHLIYDMGPDTIYSGLVSLTFVAFVYFGYPDLCVEMQYIVIALFLVICFKTWISVADYEQAIIFGDQIDVTRTRYDTETWSYRCGAIRGVRSDVIDIVVDNLMREFITSDCTLQSTSNRILYSAVEQTKKMRCNGNEIHIHVVVACAKLALQRLKGYQLSCVLDGALIKRPQTAPMI